MTHDDVIIFEKLKLKKNPKTNKCKTNFEITIIPVKYIDITRFTCLRFARQVSSPYWIRFIIFSYDKEDWTKLVTVMLVTTLFWWLYDSGRFEILVSFQSEYRSPLQIVANIRSPESFAVQNVSVGNKHCPTKNENSEILTKSRHMSVEFFSRYKN